VGLSITIKKEKNMINFLDKKVWNANHSSVWREIVRRFGQSDYDDTTKKATREATLKSEWDAQDYARNRQAEYPSLLELTVALYDTDDKSAVEAKRASVKLKYPKPS
tara:strand:+ start:73 stop:393 length:321 start_codon:yes stop_codon:yes gene_type:complete